MEVNRPYHFGVGEVFRKDSIVSRTSSKRVHWLDDEEAKLTACHQFVEHLKLLVHGVINEHDDQRQEKHLNNCRLALDELNALIDTYENPREIRRYHRSSSRTRKGYSVGAPSRIGKFVVRHSFVIHVMICVSKKAIKIDTIPTRSTAPFLF